ncbi:ExbD/TolR family protein [Mucilaginibacter calamicampi]|uniref:ExbD/TolR family protein n=1 Tax=Mucilaginibacter calamicampi TaxID=1302352 RepID=A0ABW2Z1W1_9SPHI
MPRAKVKRKSTAIDMTAMCDVAFLLLTFFILSAKPKTQDPITANPPAATSEVKLPETDFAAIIVGQGKVFYSIEGQDLRMEALKSMGEKYGVTFTPEEVVAFSNTESFGVPIKQLKQLLAVPVADRADVQQPGIPVDTTDNNELFHWVKETRKADAALHNVVLTVAIKGDSKEEYPKIADIIKTLQKQEQNKFSLITSLKKEQK